MPKAEKGSVKDIANRMKAKGLQKLKFYCQMCQKQCRDANGFKCHLTSENHLRQMKIFSDNAGGILDKYSKEFEQSYLATLRMRHGTKQVNANNVYQELIADKQHIHMNATHWTTLTEFVQYLGKTGKCVVEENERGWFVTYIQRDASILARQEAHQRREAADRAAEEAQAQRMELQRVEAAKAMDRIGATVNVEATTIERQDDDHPIKVSLGTISTSGPKGPKTGIKGSSEVLVEGFGDAEDEEGEETVEDAKGSSSKGIPLLRGPQPSTSYVPISTTKKRSRDDTVNENKAKKTKKKDPDARKDYWLYEGIVVRVITKNLADGKYFRRKAIVDRLVDKYTAEVEVLNSNPGAHDGGDVLRLDQHDLETVIPKQGDRKQKVRILNGKYRGSKAKIEYLDKKNYQADLRLSGEDGKFLKNVPFEDFSQIGCES
ncbi:Kin17 curved DNA-binding domain containing protein [Nitzschia inconspicua]|uniref:Kin17 curved DNA-binding domain containing protein n=1 Tax=Nitzschia inconspicua TaxID=303405 RepID=A0A9K3M5C9_9STRA|nr:Kin17 curved DNA-binding domain containing protein [Nitzschia inconspicua]